MITININYEIFKIPLRYCSKPEIRIFSNYWIFSDCILSHTVTCYKGIKGKEYSKFLLYIFRKKGLINKNQIDNIIFQEK